MSVHRLGKTQVGCRGVVMMEGRRVSMVVMMVGWRRVSMVGPINNLVIITVVGILNDH